MKIFKKSQQLILVFLVSITIPMSLWATSDSSSDTSLAYTKPDAWFIYGVIIVVVIFGSLFTIFSIRNALFRTNWSLEDALSESVELTDTVNEDGAKKPRLDEDGKPIKINVMRASSSRMIAMMGMIVLLLMFIGFGAFTMYHFAITGKIPESIDGVVNFLLAGLTLFAPYMVNKFTKVFEMFPKK